MRITVFLLIFSVVQVMGESSYSQNTRLSLNLKNVAIEKVLDEIENQSEFYFLFNQKLVNVNRTVDINIKNKRISDILTDLFAGEDINCLVMDRQILLSPKYITERVYVTRDRQPQEIVVTGKVTDEDGNPLPGVNIIIKGTLTGTITGLDGNFSIELEDPDAVLVFSFIGYSTQEISLEGRSVIDVIMVLDILGLDEVVVIGYGTVRKKDLTGSVESLGSVKMKEMVVTRVEEFLLGEIPGVQVKAVSGAPGSSPQIRIRGIGSISAGAAPLYVVDGFPTDNIQTLNPNDIESVDILKDASATAIYGSRGSNGVILINTKKGKAGMPTLTFDMYYGIQKVTDIPAMMNSA